MKKKIVLGLTSVVVVSAMAIGGTLAFLTSQTKEMKNTFKAVSTNVSGLIRESTWDGYAFSDLKPDSTQPDGQSANPNYTGTEQLGIAKASAMTPGMTIPKNPTLKNTSPIPVYMAIKVTYNDRAKFAAIASLAENNGWEKADKKTYAQFTDPNSDIYFYTGTTADAKGNVKTNDVLKTVDSTNTTNALFENIKIDSKIDYTTLNSNQFDVDVTGAAVQTSDISDNEAKTELVNTLK